MPSGSIFEVNAERIYLIKGKQNMEGMFISRSVKQKFKEWDFGQKKNVSPDLPYLCIRLLKWL